MVSGAGGVAGGHGGWADVVVAGGVGAVRYSGMTRAGKGGVGSWDFKGLWVDVRGLEVLEDYEPLIGELSAVR